MNWRPWYREIGDQVLHALWAGLSTLLLTDVDADAQAIGLASVIALCWREIRQWPPAPDRPWDPLMDAAGYLLGIMIACLWRYSR